MSPDNMEHAQLRRRAQLSSLLLALMVVSGILIGYVIGTCRVAATGESARALWLIAGLSTVIATSLYAGIHRFLSRALDKILERLGSHIKRFEVTLDNISQGVCFFDSEQRLIVANRRYAEIYGLPLSCIMPGTTLREIIAARLAANTSPDMTPAEYMHAREKADALDHPSDTVINLCSGQVVSIHHRSMPDRGWIATHEDITVRRHAEEETVFLAHHDPLTGLPNRQRFRTCMMDATAAQREDEYVAVLCLDLDRFKQVNDTFGHSAGDALLCAVADRLVGCVRKNDLVVRLGGDEFAIVQIGTDQPSQARVLAHRIIEVLGQPFDFDGHQALIGVSVGIALGQLGADSDLLLKNADLALYQAKADGRGNCCMFRPELREVAQTRGALEVDLREALLKHQFELFFQPLLNAQTEVLCGFEALLRWRHPVRGLVLPAEFIPLAEEIGLIVPLGEWALNEACRQAKTWPGRTKVAVNLSPVQFESDLVTMIRRALALSGLEPNRLELEITETVLLKNSAATLGTLHALHALGVCIAMDDFGTGYSSLSYLRSFPFHKIKIDRSFMRDFGQEPEALAIIRAIIYLARELRISVTAEGVETLEQLVWLRAEGCDEVQGFLFSASMPATEVATLFALFSSANGRDNRSEAGRSGVGVRLQVEGRAGTSERLTRNGVGKIF